MSCFVTSFIWSCLTYVLLLDKFYAVWLNFKVLLNDVFSEALWEVGVLRLFKFFLWKVLFEGEVMLVFKSLSAVLYCFGTLSFASIRILLTETFLKLYFFNSSGPNLLFLSMHKDLTKKSIVLLEKFNFFFWMII